MSTFPMPANFTFARGVPPVGVGMIANHWNLIKAEPLQIKTLVGNLAINSAQLAGLNSTPVQVLPPMTIEGSSSPLPNVVYVLRSVSARINFGTTAFAGGSGVGLFYGNAPSAANLIVNIPSNLFVQSTTMDILGMTPSTSGVLLSPAITEGQPVYLGNTGSALTGGDGSLELSVSYLIIQI